MSNLKEAGQRIEKMLRLRTFIVGIQLFEKAEELEEIRKIRRPNSKRVFCQVITMARTYGWTIGVTSENLIRNSFCGVMLGFYDKPDFMRNGTYKGSIWFENKEDAKKYEESIIIIPSGKFNAVVVGPISSGNFTPDLILIYGNAAQMILLINGYQWKDYERMTFHCVGESSCADVIAQCYLSKKPSLSIPCYGERRFGHVQDDELVIAMAPESLEKITEGLEKLSEKGIRYPIPFFGVQTDPNEGMPDVFKYYHSLDQ
jgi:uncharacterized protein (DUF169 family)